MKILSFFVCLSLIQVLKANEKISLIDENDVILSKIIEALSAIKSSQCKSDLNFTVSAFRDRRPWAIASKKKKCIFKKSLQVAEEIFF